MKANGKILGVLIGFDNAVPQNDGCNKENPGHVDTKPFMSITNLEGLDMKRTAVNDWEAALALILFLVADDSSSDALMDQLSKVGDT
ncbi:hypothetical protein GGI17_003812, partial [Coemansia sp. S146]